MTTISTSTPAVPLATYPVTRTLLTVQVAAAAIGALLFILPIWRGLEQGEVDTFFIGVLGMAGCLTWMTIALVGQAVLDIADNTRKQTAKGGAL